MRLDDSRAAGTMRAHALVGPRRFATFDVPAPRPDDLPPDHVLLRVHAGGICGSDLPAFEAGRRETAQNPEPDPGAPVHEVAGVVVGSRRAGIEPGQAVVGWASQFNALADYVVTDGRGVAPYDDTLSPETAVTIQPLACVLYAVEQLGEVRGRTVAVIGQGAIGLLFSHVLKRAGAARVTGIDPVDRTSCASRYGVDETVCATGEQWATRVAETAEAPDIVIEAVGHQPSTFTAAVTAAAPHGVVYLFGIPPDGAVPFALRAAFRKNLTIRSGVTVDRDRVLGAANAYLRNAPDLAAAYVTHTIPVTRVQEAFELAARPAVGRVKVVVTMERHRDHGKHPGAYSIRTNPPPP